MKLTADRMVLALALGLGLLVLDGCATRLGDFTVLSSKNVDVSGLRMGDRVSGEHCINKVFGMIPLGQVNWKEAMDDALEKAKGDVMVDIVLTMKTWAIPLIWGQDCIETEGTVAQTSQYR